MELFKILFWRISLIALVLIAFFGVFLPFLISAPSTEMVLIGVGFLFIVVYCLVVVSNSTYKVVVKYRKEKGE